jgi:nicotinamide mononucleotide adenylyltransferase
VKKILEQYESMILIIGSSEKSGTEDNPWAYHTRLSIIAENIPAELLERITIHPLADTPDDAVWCARLKVIMPTDSILFTGNEWVKTLCETHDIPTQWIESYAIDISGTKIREMIKRGEDVSAFCAGELSV